MQKYPSIQHSLNFNTFLQIMKPDISFIFYDKIENESVKEGAKWLKWFTMGTKYSFIHQMFGPDFITVQTDRHLLRQMCMVFKKFFLAFPK